MKSMRLIAECVLVAMAELCAVSCEKETEIPGTGEGLIQDAELIFGSEGGNDTILIEVSGAYTINSNASWCNAEISNINGANVVIVSVRENVTLEMREAEIQMRIGSKDMVIYIVQNPIDKYIFEEKATHKRFILPGYAVCNTDSTAEWCTVTTEYMHENCYLTIAVSGLQDIDERATTLSYFVGDEVFKLNIVQMRYYLSVSKKELIFERAASADTILIAHKGDYKIFTSDDWCTFVVHETDSLDMLVVNVDENTTASVRTGLIEIKCGKSNSIQIQVKQYSGRIYISRPSYLYYSRAPQSDTLIVNCTTGKEWILKSETYDWCSYSRYSGRNGDKLIITLSDNSIGGEREARFSLVSGEVSNTYKVYQYGIEPTPGQVVDLGLSVKWAGWNIGATKPEEVGDFFAWGETSTKTEYTDETYQYCKLTHYQTGWVYDPINIGYNISGTQYDAARANWRGDWRMPTKTEYEELFNNCTHQIVKYKNREGLLYTGKNGNSIFFPAAGNSNVSLYYRSYYYWTATSNGYYTYYMIGNKCIKNLTNLMTRSTGAPVRAVTD